MAELQGSCSAPQSGTAACRRTHGRASAAPGHCWQQCRAGTAPGRTRSTQPVRMQQSIHYIGAQSERSTSAGWQPTRMHAAVEQHLTSINAECASIPRGCNSSEHSMTQAGAAPHCGSSLCSRSASSCRAASTARRPQATPARGTYTDIKATAGKP